MKPPPRANIRVCSSNKRESDSMEELLLCEDRCVVCGRPVPEGCWVCPPCEQLSVVNTGSGQPSDTKKEGKAFALRWRTRCRTGRKKW